MCKYIFLICCLFSSTDVLAYEPIIFNSSGSNMNQQLKNLQQQLQELKQQQEYNQYLIKREIQDREDQRFYDQYTQDLNNMIRSLNNE